VPLGSFAPVVGVFFAKRRYSTLFNACHNRTAGFWFSNTDE
jgi:hypothetical protein